MKNLYSDLKSAVHSAEVLYLNSISYSRNQCYKEFSINLKRKIDNLFTSYIGDNDNFTAPEDSLNFVNLDEENIIVKYRKNLNSYVNDYVDNPAIQLLLVEIINEFNQLSYYQEKLE